ncbi:MobV family relaxase [Enterovibrio paralichthyis]|uniref:MobV family relaxase n=1 Tax=Enterovibrio paralichthyis TaxID=2853805 RepID=UPI001C476630|nr:MobV family relaxase [Enterovibrio paralichthyis]MBV7300191.1 plasmid recombination protein [Enterovibrio paralichthyis]
MATTILRFSKIKSYAELNKSSCHVNRFSLTPNADPNRYKSNRVLKGCYRYSDRVQHILNAYGIKPRKNAVIAMDAVIGLSGDVIKEKSDIDAFAREAKNFLNKKFGKRCLAITLHLDEKTPHIHALIVPLTSINGKVRLSARDTFGKKQLSDLQKSYFSHMKEFFDIVPPKHGCKSSHVKISEFYSKIESEKESLVNSYKEELKIEIGLAKEKILEDKIENLIKRIEKHVRIKEKELKLKFGYRAKEYREKFERDKLALELEIKDAFIRNQNDVMEVGEIYSDAKVKLRKNKVGIGNP